ncbi:MAG: DUF4259 domain-containing protein [Anaerolineae bacterium]|nr:DUF4259 domain-containing protein [Anaerolineae bacterium]
MDWDVRSFGNEQAQEWLKELSSSLTGDLVTEALETVDQSDIFVDSQDAERAVAACEVVAASRQKASVNNPVEVGLWVKAQKYTVSAEVVALAIRVIERIYKSSELRDLWDGTDAAKDWRNSINDLCLRLEQSLSGDEAIDEKAGSDAGADQDVDSIFNDAIELVRTGNHRGAISKFSHAINLNPEYVVGYIGRGTSFLALGKFEEAVQDLNNAIDRDPELAEAYYLRAQAYFQSQHFGRAIADLSILINMQPERSEAYLVRGLANVSIGRNEKAIEDFSNAINHDAACVNAYLQRSRCYEKAGRFDLAGKDRKQYERLATEKV